MSVRAHFLSHASADSNQVSNLLWHTDASPEETVAQLSGAIGDRDGSWTDGSVFQLAPNCNPWAPVLKGRVQPKEGGAEIRAELDLRQELRDMMRLGRWMLLGLIMLLATGALLQLRGMDLWLSLGALALGAASAVGAEAILQAYMLEAATRTFDRRQLCQLLTQMLRH